MHMTLHMLSVAQTVAKRHLALTTPNKKLHVRLVEGDIPVRPLIFRELVNGDAELSIAWTKDLGRFQFLRRLSEGFLTYSSGQTKDIFVSPWMIEGFARHMELELYPALLDVYRNSLRSEESVPFLQELFSGNVDSFSESLACAFLISVLEKEIPQSLHKNLWHRLCFEKDSWMILKETLPHVFGSREDAEMWWMVALRSDIETPQGALESAEVSGKRLEFFSNVWVREAGVYHRRDIEEWRQLVKMNNMKKVLLLQLTWIRLHLSAMNPIYHNAYLSLGAVSRGFFVRKDRRSLSQAV